MIGGLKRMATIEYKNMITPDLYDYIGFQKRARDKI